MTREVSFSSEAFPPLPVFSQAIKANGVVYCSGSIGIDRTTDKLAVGVQDQTAAALANMTAVLKAAGSSLEDVVKVNVYLTDLKKDFAAMNEIYIKLFGTSPPARTCVGVAQLPLGAEVEIECTALVKP